MPLTPADVHNVVFKKPSMGQRGYDGDEVDAFRDVIEAELARLIEENNELRASGGGHAPVRQEELAMQGDDVRASRILALATETADRYVNEAKAKGEQVLTSAKTNSQRLTADARQKSEQMVAEAQHRADSMMGDARTRAAAMAREARAHAAALELDAERRHVEAISLLEEKRSSLQREIEELHTSEREYRTRLRSYLESHLRDLEGRGSAESASNTRQNQPVFA